MLDELKNLKEKAKQELASVTNSEALRELEVRFLGRKGELTGILRGLKDLAPEERNKIGKLANEIKTDIETAIAATKTQISGGQTKAPIDVTLPGQSFPIGHLHPITQIQTQLEDIFTSLGFIVEDGPELESEFFNFEALNIPADHPARDMQDTFFIEEGKNYDPKDRLLMRTHTSNNQVRALKKYGVPLRAVFPGRCFRNEATDAVHEHTFYQMEGLMVDKDISIANLIGVMKILLSQVFQKEVKVRLRPGYFPFVEPGFELDINCLICGGSGCAACKNSGWLEILPCGLVHPSVLSAGGVDPKSYSGFAFGLGLTRLAMQKYGITDIRLFQSGDLRFLNQF